MHSLTATLPRPFLKWAGGKTRLLNTLVSFIPKNFSTYHEPFVGGGALFFYLVRENKLQKAVLSDINQELIDTFCAIRDCVSDVIRVLSTYKYDKCFYYYLRRLDPQKLSLAERAARMIYLNKTCYNGLYRVNRKGKFNVPFGLYKSPKYLDTENLLAVSKALQNIDIRCEPFENVLSRVCPYDWVYFDPPYVPTSKTANFTEYTPYKFTLEDHERLRDVCLKLHSQKVYVTVSNSKTPFVLGLYNLPCFNFWEIEVKRNISCKKDRENTTELLITNY